MVMGGTPESPGSAGSSSVLCALTRHDSLLTRGRVSSVGRALDHRSSASSYQHVAVVRCRCHPLELPEQPLERVHVGGDHRIISFTSLRRFAKTDAEVITRGGPSRPPRQTPPPWTQLEPSPRPLLRSAW